MFALNKLTIILANIF